MRDESGGPVFARSLGERVRIGQGRAAEIFEWDGGRALRLYRSGTSRDWVRRELHVTRSVYEAGLPAPAVHPADSEDGLLEVDGRIGFVMERVDGPSMFDELTARPWRLWRYASLLADLHRAIHRTAVGDLPSQRERLLRLVDRIEPSALAPGTLARIRSTIEERSCETATCHGDLHPDNVLMSARGPVVIDWGGATLGTSSADVARTILLTGCGTAPVGSGLWKRLAVSLFSRLFLRAYRRAYVKRSSLRAEEIAAWAPVVAAVRLTEGIPKERAGLVRIVARYVG